MAIKTENRQYETLLDYLKKEHPDFYSQFRELYHNKRKVFPDMTEQQCLILVSQGIEKRKRVKLESLDESLVSEEEIAKLESLIGKSEKLQEAATKYSEVQRTSPYLSKEDVGKLQDAAADRVYDELKPSDKKNYDRKIFRVVMKRLNLGPWTINRNGNGSGEGIEEIIERNKDLFEGNEEIAVRLYERYYEQQIQSQRTIEGARRVLGEKK